MSCANCCKADIPGHDTPNDAIDAIDGGFFAECFTAWADTLRDPAAVATSASEIVIIDGRTSRRTHDWGP